MTQKKLLVSNSEITRCIFGSFDKHARRLEEAFGVRIFNRADENGAGDCIVIEGEDGAASRAHDALSYMKKAASLGDELSDQSVDYVIRMISDGAQNELAELDDDCFFVTARGKPVKAKTVGQKKYVDAINKNTIVISTGPAGTGKTYLAVAMAVKALRKDNPKNTHFKNWW